MKRPFAAAALGALLCSAAPAAASDRVTTAQLEAALERGVDDGAPGFSAAIATRRGIVWTGVAGKADLSSGASVDEADMFAVASLTKSFVAVVALQLVQEGKLDLDAPLGRYLRAGSLKGIANARQATIGDLLDHYSGVASWEDAPDWIHHARGAQAQPARIWTERAPFDFVVGLPATGRPGTAYHYSNTDAGLVGLAIEAVTHQPLAATIRSRILAPLHLRHTYLQGFEPMPGQHLAHRYHYATADFIRDAGVSPHFPVVRPGLIDVSSSNVSWDGAAGAMVSTARDIASFALALRDGRLLSPALLAKAMAWRPADDGWGVGLGLFRMVNAHGIFIGHTGNTLGGTGAFAWSAEGDAIIVVLSNVGASHAGKSGPNGSRMAINSAFTDLALRFADQETP